METPENVKNKTIIEVIDGGPLKITGNIILKDLKRDITESAAEIFLCRCGRSANMPFCDDSHKRQ